MYSEREYMYKNSSPNYFDIPKGWGNPWPDLPSPDDETSGIDLSSICLSVPRNRCAANTLLGYYIGWHIVGVSFQNEKGRDPHDGEELKAYNDSLPEENKFGVHICMESIDNYIRKFSTEGVDKDHVSDYLEYCTYLTLIYVIAHEWGHYRSEVLSFQVSKLSESVTGRVDNEYRPCYLSYFVNKKMYPESNFEEVFAEWAALKLGVYNFYMKPPSFAADMTNWSLIESTVKFMLTKVMSSPSRTRPYSDIRHWVDFKSITENTILKRFSENRSSINRSVNDNVRIEGVRSLYNGKIIDLLVHNQMQFSRNRRFNGIVESSWNLYPLHPDSLFYHFGYDDCLDAHKASKTENYLRLSMPPQIVNFSYVRKVLYDLKESKSDFIYFPIKVFPDILPLDAVYFH